MMSRNKDARWRLGSLFRAWICVWGIGSWFAISGTMLGQELSWKVMQPGPKVSLRGISVVSDSIAWACGSKGTVMRTDGGWTEWKAMTIAAWPELEFRSIHGLDERRAVVASAGTPAIIMATEDGGESWKEVYRHPSSQAFFDGFTFWNPQQGLAISDPVDGKWLMLRTEDGGQHWSEVTPTLEAIPGEAAFAASSGSLFALNEQQVWLGTGGGTKQSFGAIYCKRAMGWHRSSVPIATNESSGVFAVHFSSASLGVAVGGDYRRESEGKDSAAWSEDGGQTWQPALAMPSGFRSSVAHLVHDGDTIWIAVGPSGTDQSSDGKTWRHVSDTGFHAVRSMEGKVLAIGSAGRIGIMDGLKSKRLK